MAHPLVAFAGCAVPFLVLDGAWLALAGPNFYKPAIGHLMAADVDWVAAGLFYVIYLCGLVAFAVLASRNVREAALRGAGLGFMAYATYDLTNQATMANWPWMVTVVDLAWGTVVTATACAVSCALTQRVAAQSSQP